FIENPLRAEFITGNRIVTTIVMIIAISKYIWLLIFPLNLNYNHTIVEGINNFFHHEYYSGKEITIPSVSSPKFIASAIFITIISAFIIKTKKNKPVVSFSVMWVVISLLPVMQFMPTSSLFAERYLYISSFGFTLLLSWIISKDIKKHKKYSRAATIATLIITCLYFRGTYSRNMDWKNPITFWTKTFSQNPKSSFVNSEVAKAYSDRGNRENAKKYIINAVELNPENPINIFNLATIYFQEKDYEQAISLFQKSIELKPEFFQAYAGIGNVLLELNQNSEAEIFYKKSLLINPNHVESLINLSTSFLRQNKKEEALSILIKAKKMAPHIKEIDQALRQVREN
ncbi:tetratricopeptide repeat protein, partial [Patescibacteria group bacterium]